VDTTCAIVQTMTGDTDQRRDQRRAMDLSGRLVWKDAQSATRFSSVRIRNLSESGAYVECLSGTPIPPYRLVYLQTERPVDHADLPLPLRRGRALAAVFRVETGPGRGAAPRGYGLRLLTDPPRASADRSPRRSAVTDPLRAAAGGATA
jgi:hypothetical protein